MADYEKIGVSELTRNSKEIVACGIAVYRKNREGKMVILPVENLNTLLGGSSAMGEFYIRGGWQEEIKEMKERTLRAQNRPRRMNPIEEEIERTKERIRAIELMSNAERALSLIKKSDRVKNIVSEKRKTFTREDAKEVVDASSEATMASNVSMREALAKIEASEITQEEAQKSTEAVALQTKDIVSSVIELVTTHPDTQEIFSQMENYAQGATIAHSNRVFMMFVNFMLFYNNFMAKSGVHKLRQKFRATYRPLYHKLLQGKPIASLEDVVEKGLKRIDDNEVRTLSIGALLHDIGKVSDLEYFEGAQSRDMRIITKHVFDSYKLLMKTSTYPLEVAALAAYHHEYYGHKDGYGVLRGIHDLRTKQGTVNFEYALSYDRDSVERFSAKGFFPAKVLEVIDVYDALTDPSRDYRDLKVFNASEALPYIRDNFILKEFKVDPILFDLFVDYMGIEKKSDFSLAKIAR